MTDLEKSACDVEIRKIDEIIDKINECIKLEPDNTKLVLLKMKMKGKIEGIKWAQDCDKPSKSKKKSEPYSLLIDTEFLRSLRDKY